MKKILVSVAAAAVLVTAGTAVYAEVSSNWFHHEEMYPMMKQMHPIKEQVRPMMEQMHPELSQEQVDYMYETCHGNNNGMRMGMRGMR